MRRLLLVSLLALTACARSGPLSSDEVLHRAALASQQLLSASFSVDGTLTLSDPENSGTAHATMNGVLQDGGKQTQFSLELTGTMGTPPQSFAAKADATIASPSEIYLRLQSLALAPPSDMFPTDALTQLMGKWWKIPAGATEGVTDSIAPDPSLLRAQAEVVTVARDEGVQTIRGRDAYVYAVAVDKEKLLAYMRNLADTKREPFVEEEARKFLAGFQATGELWIDAETFYVHRLSWVITPAEESGKAYHLAFTADLSDHGEAPPVTPPAGAVEFSPDALPGLLPPLSLPAPSSLPGNP